MKNNIKDYVDKQGIIEYKTARIIQLLMELKGISRTEATKLWFNSKTKAATLDSTEYYLSVARIYDELEMEQNNHPMWMLRSFE